MVMNNIETYTLYQSIIRSFYQLNMYSDYYNINRSNFHIKMMYLVMTSCYTIINGKRSKYGCQQYHLIKQ